jgi:tetratricopeptide (TPR) repeat protein/DNA-binding PadR family transcriptional regulator
MQLSIAEEGDGDAGGEDWTVPQISASLDGWGDRTDFVVLEALDGLRASGLVTESVREAETPLGPQVAYELTEAGRTRARELRAALATGSVAIGRNAEAATVTAELTTEHYADEMDSTVRIERSVAECFGAIEATVELSQPSTVTRYCQLLGEKARVEVEHGADLMAASTATREYQLAVDNGLRTRAAEAALLRGRAAGALDAHELAREQLEQALGTFQTMDDPARIARTHAELAIVDWDRGERALARDHHQQAVSCYQQLGDERGQARAHDRLGSLAYEQGAFEDATAYLDQAVAAYRSIGDQHAAGETLGRQGGAAWRRGALDRARDHYSDALSAFQAADDLPGVAKIHNNLGALARERGDHQTAQTQFAHALETFRTLGQFGQAAIARFNLGKTLERQGADDQATKRLRTALATFESDGDTHRVGGVYATLGHIARKRRAYDEAREHYRTALEAFETAEDRRRILRTRVHLGTIALATGAHDRASEQLRTVVQDADPEHDYRIVAMARARLAQIDERRGNEERARTRATDALFEVPDGSTDAAVVRTILGRIARSRGDVDRARELFSTAAETGVEDAGPLARSPFRPTIERGALERACGSHEEARQQLERARSRAESADDPHLLAATNAQLGALAHDCGHDEEARDRLGSALDGFRAVGDRYGIGTVRRRQGLLAYDRGEDERARDHWQQALDALDDVGASTTACDAAEALLEDGTEADPDRLREWAANARSIPE